MSLGLVQMPRSSAEKFLSLATSQIDGDRGGSLLKREKPALFQELQVRVLFSMSVFF